MNWSKIVAVIVVISLLCQSCAATIYLKEPSDVPDECQLIPGQVVGYCGDGMTLAREVEGKILKNDGTQLYVNNGSRVLEIPVALVEDIDHPGWRLGVAGVVTSLVGVAFFATAVYLDSLIALYLLAMPGMFLTVTGIPIGLVGVSIYASSKRSSRAPEDHNSLNKSGTTPAPFSVQASDGFGLIFRF